MRTFKKSIDVAGFSAVSIDKMFKISGGSLTTWGLEHYGNSAYGSSVYEVEKFKNYTGEFSSYGALYNWDTRNGKYLGWEFDAEYLGLVDDGR